jgi:hypothetical protein
LRVDLRIFCWSGWAILGVYQEALDNNVIYALDCKKRNKWIYPHALGNVVWIYPHIPKIGRWIFPPVYGYIHLPWKYGVDISTHT